MDADARERQRVARVRLDLPHRTGHGGDWGNRIIDRVATDYARWRKF